MSLEQDVIFALRLRHAKCRLLELHDHEMKSAQVACIESEVRVCPKPMCIVDSNFVDRQLKSNDLGKQELLRLRMQLGGLLP